MDAAVKTKRVRPDRWDAERSGTTTGRLMPGCAATLQLQFGVTEYLKGSGPDRILIEDNLSNRYDVSGGSLQYLTDGQARYAAWAWWNTQEGAPRRKDGVLFLPKLSQDGVAGASLLSRGDSYDRHWVPVTAETWLSADQNEGAPRSYSESGPPGEGSSPVVMPLADLRSRIAAFDALLQKGEGVDGYTDCIEWTIRAEAAERRDRARYGPDYKPSPYARGDQMPSGLPAGAGIRKDRQYYSAGYETIRLEGPDHRHFTIEIVDDDDSSGNGYYAALTAARPLPAGTYRFSAWSQSYEETLCDFTVNGYALSPFTTGWIVEVVPSAQGTLHEAFFDPVASDGFIGASAATGVLSPAGFSINGEAGVIESMGWEAGLISLEASAPAALIGYDVDVILPDASILRTLSASDAKLDGERGALTWEARDPPWRGGENLMLRIRAAGPVPVVPAPRAWVPAVLNLTAAVGTSNHPDYKDRGVAILQWEAGDGVGGADPELQQWYSATQEWGDLPTTLNRTPSPCSTASRKLSSTGLLLETPTPTASDS